MSRLDLRGPRAFDAAMPEELKVPGHLTVANADFGRALAFVEGRIVPLAEAKVPVRDLGLMYADMTYDVVHSWRGGFFRLDDHLDRFLGSCAGLRLHPGHDREGLRRILGELLRRSGLADTLVYFACTRGMAVPGTRDPTRSRNSFFATVTPLILRGQPDEMRRGLHATLSHGVARIPAEAVNPAWKNSHWGDFVRASFAAKDSGHDVPILLATDGAVAEAPGFNVVALVNGGLVSPDRGVLEGISCRTMMEIAGDLGIPARYGRLMPGELVAADEVFLTATSCGLYPVTRIDGRPVGAGVPGPVTTRLLNTYYERKNAGWHVTPASSIPAPEGIAP